MTGARYFKQNADLPQPDEPSRSLRNYRIRQAHRWLAILFTVTVVANLIAMTKGPPPPWITYSPLTPLFLLMGTGLYMFALPYLRRSGDHA